ncbi:MAG TPA: cupin domain-containing protein [Geobacteraceae bacterium]|jgi:predicted cupin superfamily sugar epimerase|nr:cupin domain-containing protein [Geobacteraceae bacterium]
MTAAELIDLYKLQPHREGGWYREVHRSDRFLGLLPGYPGERTALTAIYFLLAAGEFSAFHRVRSEEAWVHLAGAPLELVFLEEEPRIVPLASAGYGEPLAVVPPGVLQAARSLGDYTLAACLVAPGFDFADFEIPSRERLESAFPRHTELVRRFTRLPSPD